MAKSGSWARVFLLQCSWERSAAPATVCTWRPVSPPRQWPYPPFRNAVSSSSFEIDNNFKSIMRVFAKCSTWDLSKE